MVRAFQNIFACLVHESQECVIDLVRNLRCLDPASTILLYNGGSDPDLLGRGFPFERYGAIVVPRPRTLAWGWLHDFALDCARFALEAPLPFDTITVVDSDQLATRPGYSSALQGFLGDRPRAGMIASTAGPQPVGSQIAPVKSAFQEFDLWRPFLRRFPDGESKFVHWTFWPSTVLTRRAAQDLVSVFDNDALLRETLARSRIWATEEILLPTLVALLGHEVVASPFSGEFVRFRVGYNRNQIDRALESDTVFWLHPVARHYGDGLRRYVRERHDHYQLSFDAPAERLGGRRSNGDSVAATLSRGAILATMEQTEGWLSRCEGDLLITAVLRALTELGSAPTLVEIGSYCGRSTVVLGGVVKSFRPSARVYAWDTFDGIVGALDQGLFAYPPTGELFRSNIDRAGLSEIVVSGALDGEWTEPIGFLLIDGLHDYVNVARDFFRFEPFVVEGGYVVFHDYADYFPGVKAFVNELLGAGRYEEIDRVGSLIVVRK